MTSPAFMKLCDAHTHYHFGSLAPFIENALTEARAAGLAAAVVNGTCEDDWPSVREFVKSHPWTRAAYGLHPWQVPQRSGLWENVLRACLLADLSASVGEIGLDAWIPGHDPEDQKTVFLRQWIMAVELARPVTVHCIQAWEPLRQMLRCVPELASGFLIHAYNGPPEWIPQFVAKGAHFSFSPYFLLDRKRPQREAFRLMPPDRILIETDAPALSPPPERNPHPIIAAAGGELLNHPANIVTCLRSLAETLERPEAEIAVLTSCNWERLFGQACST